MDDAKLKELREAMAGWPKLPVERQFRGSYEFATDEFYDADGKMVGNLTVELALEVVPDLLADNEALRAEVAKLREPNP